MTTRRLVILLFAIGSQSLTPAIQLARADDTPQWLIDARAKEGTLGALQTVKSTDGLIEFRVPIQLTGKLDEDGKSYTATFTLGPQTVATCEILKEAVDTAALLQRTAQMTFSDVVEKQQGKIEARAIEALDADVAGDAPYLAARWIYRVNDGKAPLVGALQQIGADKAGHGVYCALNDLGYAKTFNALARSVIESLSVKDAPAAPYYREVSLVSLRDMRVGYAQISLRHDKDGDIQIDQQTALLLPASSDTLRAQDTFERQWAHLDGALINGIAVTGSNGDIESNLSLKAGDAGSWLVAGTVKGKDVKVTIAGGAPGTWLSQLNLRRALLAKEKPVGAEATYTLWLSADPGRLTEIPVKVIEAVDAQHYRVRETTAGIVATYEADRASGDVARGVMQLGPVEMVIERVVKQGAL